MATLNAVVIIRLLTKECVAFSNFSVFGGHTENGSFSRRTVFKFMLFHHRFRKAPFSQRNTNGKTEKFYYVFIRNGAV